MVRVGEARKFFACAPGAIVPIVRMRRAMTFGDSPSGLTPAFAGMVLLASVVWSIVTIVGSMVAAAIGAGLNFAVARRRLGTR
jgi:hypothetical protein